MTTDMNEIRCKFIEEIGLVAQDEGMPRIAGRMMGLMVFDGEPRSFGDLAKELQVSRGSISTNARMLAGLGVIKRVALPGDRQDYYQLAESPYKQILLNAAARTRKAERTIAKTADALPEGYEDVGKRVCAYRDFYTLMADSLTKALDDSKE